MAGKGRSGVALVMALILLVAGAVIILVNLDHPVGIIGRAVTALVGVGFFVRGVSVRKTTPEGRRRFFMS
ncbi:hypothetical protein GCM10029964_029290 [Kibdelosporangium lantanae]